MKNLFSLFLISVLVTSCLMVGPNYRTPDLLMPDAYSEEHDVGDEEESFDVDLAHWWRSFNDPLLDSLLSEALCSNFDLRIAIERVCQVRSSYRIQRAYIFPEVESDIQGVRSRASQSFIPDSDFLLTPFQNFFQTGFDAIWELDIFGGLRRAARAAYHTWEASVEDANAVRIVVLAEVANAYTSICALQQSKSLLLQTIDLDEENLSLAYVRFDAGLTNEQEVEIALAALEQDRADFTILDANLKQAVYALAVLLGKPPEYLLETFSTPRPIPVSLGKIPIGLPADLLRRRPDIRSAERQIAAATEQIGVAIADLFPRIRLTGSSGSFSANPLQGANIGFATTEFEKLFTAPSLIWGLGALVNLPIFDFGRRWATIDGQVCLEHQIFLNYEKIVLTALQEVESDLVAYYNEQERLQDLTRQVEANQRTFDLVTDLFEAGLASYTQVLQAQDVLLTSLNLQTISQQDLTLHLIALYKALGGGWECFYMP